jgi:acyl-coenzyme A thioesterase PaaI-like protein
MNSKLLKAIDYLIKKSETKTGLIALEKIFKIGIPFNKPHGIFFKKLSHYESVMLMKNKRLNHNHLGGIHACAIATVGEFSAGLLLCKNFEMSSFRVIIKEINVTYSSQARKNILSKATIDATLVEDLKKRIVLNSQADVELETEIKDFDGKEIAVVKTLWQLKSWNEVRK